MSDLRAEIESAPPHGVCLCGNCRHPMADAAKACLLEVMDVNPLDPAASEWGLGYNSALAVVRGVIAAHFPTQEDPK